MLQTPSVVSILQPNRADIFDQLFVSRFIESFGFKAPAQNTPPPTWLDELAVFLTLPAPSLVKHSIRAGSMFFYGSLADDVSIKTEACRWYTRSLKGLQDLLSHKTSSFTGDVICAVVMLTHFENLAGTSTEAWFQHVRGAVMMLESGGVESCREGFLHQLFRHLRILVVSQPSCAMKSLRPIFDTNMLPSLLPQYSRMRSMSSHRLNGRQSPSRFIPKVHLTDLWIFYFPCYHV